MTSRFFRRPSDDNSNSSSDDDTENLDKSQRSSGSIQEPEVELAENESPPTDASVTSPDRSEFQHDSSMLNVAQHRDLMFASLLEEWCKTRAAELINTGTPGFSYHRQSPEAQTLARKLYADASQALASNGFVSPTSTNTNMGNVRKQYMAGLDNLSMRNVQDRDLAPVHDTKYLREVENNLALVKAERRGSAELIKAFDPPVSSILMQTGRMSISSPQADMQMTVNNPSRSHYESSFQQIKLLGKGGFGRVYHAYNLFDNKEYAVKKIPLSPRLSERYKKSGHHEIESVLREVQALARLEHSNCVRYHACWVEEPQLPASPPSSQSSAPLALRKHRLLKNHAHSSTDQPQHSLAPVSMGINDEHSDRIVFGLDGDSRQDSRDLKPKMKEWSVASLTEDSAPPTRASELFTDGLVRASDHTDTLIDHSVYVLHVQMSMYPLTLAQYLAPALVNSTSALSSPFRRHCFHLLPSLRILLGILCGLQYIHAKGLIHRDIKPGNIFLSTSTSDDGIALSEGFWDVGSCPSCPDAAPYYINPRIGDFGLVAELVKSAGEVSDTSLGQSPKTKPVGTEFYRPPSNEKYDRGGRPAIDEKLDVFALGVMLVEMLCAFGTSSERMHVLKDLQEGTMPKSLAAEIESEDLNERGLGQRIEECIKGMTRLDSGRRWGCQRVKEAIEDILDRCDAGPSRRMDGANMRKVRSLSSTETDA